MIREISNQELDNFSSTIKYSQFLQSSSWMNFEKNSKNNFWQMGLFDDIDGKEMLVAVFCVIEKKLPFNFSYLYCPRGPIIIGGLNEELEQKYLRIILKGIRDICISTKTTSELFLRFEPNIDPISLENTKKVKSFQPENTLILNLNSTLEEILNNMHQKTRYNINLARKKGVEVDRVETTPENKKIFFNLIDQTAKRDKFVSHTNVYYEKLLDTKAGNAYLWFAKYNGNVLCTNIVMSHGDTVTYTHGASANIDKNIMAPYLLQFEQIKWAKENGFKYYDFWGVSKTEDKNDPWYGFSRFKKGYGGEIKTYPGTYEQVFNQKFYLAYSIYKKIRKFL